MMSVGELIKLLQEYADKYGDHCPVGVYDHKGVCREEPFIYSGNISTELRSRGEEVDW